jgi:hypothetical protein
MNATALMTPLNGFQADALLYRERVVLISGRGAKLALRAFLLLTSLAFAACGGTPGTASPPAKDACTVAAVMVPIRAALDTAATEAVVQGTNGDLKCVAGIARITVLIGAVSAPSDGPQGSPHLVLLEDDSGSWVVANDKLCGVTGESARPIPPELGDVCGVQ